MKLTYCYPPTVGTFLLLVSAPCLPLLVAIQNVGADTDPMGPTKMPSVAWAMLHPAFCIALFAVAIVLLQASIRGAARASGFQRLRWVRLVVVNSLTLLGAALAVFLLPKFAASLKDLGIK